MAGHDEEQDHRDELVWVEPVGVVARLDEGGEEIVLGGRPPLVGELEHEVGRGAEDPVGLLQRGLGRGGLVHRDQ